jgi:hypothetical protein
MWHHIRGADLFLLWHRCHRNFFHKHPSPLLLHTIHPPYQLARACHLVVRVRCHGLNYPSELSPGTPSLSSSMPKHVDAPFPPFSKSRLMIYLGVSVLLNGMCHHISLNSREQIFPLLRLSDYREAQTQPCMNVNSSPMMCGTLHSSHSELVARDAPRPC